MSFILILSFIAIPWGIVALGHHTKHLPISLRYAPVFLTVLGAIIGWQNLATYFPVIDNTKIEIISAHSKVMVVDIKGEKVRDCTKMSLSAHLIDGNGRSLQVDLIHSGNPASEKYKEKMGNFDTEAMIVLAGYVDNYKELYFTATHECALGVTVVSTFGQTTIPPEFNAVE